MGNHRFHLENESYIAELEAKASVYRHPGGAVFYHLKNSDRNKAFCIAVDGWPDSDNGAAHVLEHALFSGSEKYPLKEPFVTMKKCSLQTFLNAMTMSDRCLYPVASTNAKDLLHLIHIYLDGVYHPLIAKDPLIFMQEGFRFDFDEEGEVIGNGVVYNEEKAMCAAPEQILRNMANRVLFRDLYCYCPGGIPAAMIGMDGEEIVRFHRTFYRGAASRFFLYGDMEAEAVLTMVEAALAGSEERPIPRKPPVSCAIKSPQYLVESYGGFEGTDLGSLTFYLGSSGDPVRNAGLRVLMDTLFHMEASPLRQELLERGICQDLYMELDDGGDAMVASLLLYGPSSGDAREMEQAVLGAMGALTEESILPLCRAALSRFRFAYRADEGGAMPKGVSCSLQLLGSAQTEEDPFLPLRHEAIFDEVEEQLESGALFASLKASFSGNPHRVSILLFAEEALMTEEAEREARAVKDAWEALSDEERERYLTLLEELEARQERPDPPEVEALVPRLTREDLGEAPVFRDVAFSTLSVGEGDDAFRVPLYHYEENTRDIIALRLHFPVAEAGEEDLFLLSTLAGLLGGLATKHYTQEQLELESLKELGEFLVYPEAAGGKLYFVCDLCFLREKWQAALDLCREVLLDTRFDGEADILMRLWAMEARYRSELAEEAMRFASEEALAMIRWEDWVDACTGGVPYYERLGELLRSPEEIRRKTWQKMEKRLGELLKSEGLIVSLIGDAEGKKEGDRLLSAFLASLLGSEKQREFVKTAVAAEAENAADGLASVPVNPMDAPDHAPVSAGDLRQAHAPVSAGDLRQAHAPVSASDLRQAHAPVSAGDLRQTHAPVSVTGLRRSPERRGYPIPSSVQYIAMVGRYGRTGDFDGRFYPLRTLLENDYLWTEIRLKGGAYGSSFTFGRENYFLLTSYRDPNCRETLEAFRTIPAYLRSLDLDDREVFDLILGCLGEFDRPLTALEAGDAAIGRAFRGWSAADLLREREELLSMKGKDLKELADLLEEGVSENIYVVFGNEGILEEEKDAFDTLYPMRGPEDEWTEGE